MDLEVKTPVISSEMYVVAKSTLTLTVQGLEQGDVHLVLVSAVATQWGEFGDLKLTHDGQNVTRNVATCNLDNEIER